MENLFASLSLTDQITYEKTTAIKELHPGRAAAILLQDEVIGYLGQVHPSTAKAYDLTETYVAELDLDRLIATENAALIYQAVSKFPSVNRDIALLVDEKTSNQTILQTIEQAAGSFLTDIHLFDVYQGKNIDSNKNQWPID